MLFRLVFLIFIFSTIIISVARSDNSNPSHNPNIIIITVPYIASTKATNSVVTSTILPKNKLKNPNPLRRKVKNTNFVLALDKAYIKLKMRENKRHNRAERKWKK